MAIFGSVRDIAVFKGISRELLEDIISTQCGYYKIVLDRTTANTYGEAMNKTFIGPVLIDCLIDKGDFSTFTSDFGPDSKRTVNFRFLKDHLVDTNVIPEQGDIVMYNESFYEIFNVNENQQILGKDSDYSYSEGLNRFGSSLSIICETHLTSPDSLGIERHRL